MDKKICKECAHFCQHYTLDQRRIFRIYCGHCTLQRIRNKQPDAIACKHYAAAPPEGSDFVSKEYLSKELLQYLMRLELLPQIEDAPEDQMGTNGRGNEKASLQDT